MYRVILIILFSIQFSIAQDYIEYATGSASDLVVNPDSGICLMGGASESDEAMVWFLNKANGGDVVVLRASGSNGYNNYFYSELGVTVNSVTTFVINNEAGATNEYVLDKVEKAEAIWFAGGEQFDYVITDSMTVTDFHGQRLRLWMEDETTVGNPEEFMEMLVSRIEKIMVVYIYGQR